MTRDPRIDPKAGDVVSKNGIRPEDDDEPIDFRWWFSLVGSNSSIMDLNDAFFLYWNGRYIELVAQSRQPGEQTYTRKLKHIKTRGDFRRLCEALGVELKVPE